MKYVWFAVILGFTALVQADAPAPNQARTLKDFAEGLSLFIQPELSVQTMLLPIEVYRGTREGHPDLAVFNARGEAVPFALRSLHSRTRRRQEEQTVPLFPLRQPESRPAGSPLRMQIRRDDAGTIIEVAAPGAEATRARTKVVGYLFDASKLEQPFDRVRLSWDTSAESFQTRVQIEGSDDLANWQVLSAGVVGELRHAGQSIERREILLVPSRAKYLRLQWEGDLPASVTASHLRVEQESVEQSAPRLRLMAQAVRAADHEYRADLGGVLPLTGVAPRVPEDTLVAGGLSLRTRLDQPLAPLASGQFYRLRHSNMEFVNPPVELDFVSARYVSLQLDPRTDSMFNGLAFDVEYAPEQLLFLTRGGGSYTLAFGSYRAAAPAFEADKLLAFMPEATRNLLPLESARVIAAQALAGDVARREPLPPRSYRMQVLWAVLIVGAGLLVVLALRLLRRMER